MLWFSSDQHFGHKGVITFCKRPFSSVEEMDEALIVKWNAQVKPTDTAYILGDFSFHKAAVTIAIGRRLNGKKFLVKGNHDRLSDTQYRAAGFEAIYEEVVMRPFGKPLRLCHYPYWPRNPEAVVEYELRYPHLRPTRNPTEFLLCGHVHGWFKLSGRTINVGADAHHYNPVASGLIEKWTMQIERGLAPSEELVEAERPRRPQESRQPQEQKSEPELELPQELGLQKPPEPPTV